MQRERRAVREGAEQNHSQDAERAVQAKDPNQARSGWNGRHKAVMGSVGGCRSSGVRTRHSGGQEFVISVHLCYILRIDSIVSMQMFNP